MSFIGKALFGESGKTPQQGYGYQEQGELLNELLTNQAQQAGRFSGIPELNFSSQYNPYQFTNTFNANQAVQDAFTPQAQNIESIYKRQAAEQVPQIQADLARRGLQTSAAAPWALAKNQENAYNAQSNALASLAGQQASANLQANQFAAQMEQQRQLQQAAELFRNRGASDAQALQMAQFAMARQQQPIQNLMNLYGMNMQGTQGYQASPGLFQTAASGLGQGAGMALGAGLFCLPKGTEIETSEGKIKIEDIKVGDEVIGGKVISKSQTLRTRDHKFYKHNFENGFVVMSKGHPYFDELKSIEDFENDSECTYDILTEDGYYYVDGIKLGSTIRG